MQWNLKSHITDHSALTIDNLNLDFNESDSKNIHFTLSIDLCQLLINHNCKFQDDVDNLMKSFLKDLSNHSHTFEESKGKYINKNNETIQRRRVVQFDFTNALLAYHNSSSDNINSKNYNVEPHIHILFDKKKRTGIGYYQLRSAIEKISNKYGLIFNFQEETASLKDNSLALKNSNFSWFNKRASDMNFQKKVLNNAAKLNLEIDDVIKNYKNTGNFQYYIKTMRDFSSRLSRQNLDFFFNGVNLKDTFPLFLSDSQKDTLRTLHQGSHEDIYNLISNRENKIARAYVESRYGFNNIIINEFKKRGVNFLNINLDSSNINLNINKKSSSNDKYHKTLNYCYKTDFTQALIFAKNEKDLQNIMINLGYTDFKYKQQTINNKRSRIGFTFINSRKKIVTINYSSFNLSSKDIRSKLVENSNKNISYDVKELKSAIKNYIPKSLSKTNILFEEIYNFDTSYDLTKWYIKENSTTYDIELFNETTHIVDSGNILIVKKHEPKDLTDNAILLIDMAIAKGWDLNEIEISGTDEFIECIENEIQKRRNGDDSTSVDTVLSDENLESNTNNPSMNTNNVNNEKSVRSSLNL